MKPDQVVKVISRKLFKIKINQQKYINRINQHSIYIYIYTSIMSFEENVLHKNRWHVIVNTHHAITRTSHFKIFFPGYRCYNFFDYHFTHVNVFFSCSCLLES